MDTRMKHKKKSVIEQDLILVHVEEKPAFFGRVERIIPDIKNNWWRVSFLVLQIPLRVITWIIDDNQIRGEEFTMGGTPIRIEKVEVPEGAFEDLPESKKESKSEKPSKDTTDTEEKQSKGKQARILTLGSKTGR